MSDDFREDLVDILVNGLNIEKLGIDGVNELMKMIDELKHHFMSDEKLAHLFFTSEANVIMHEENGSPSTFGVIVNQDEILFRTEDGKIDNHKNAGRILMSTIRFIGGKFGITEETAEEDIKGLPCAPENDTLESNQEEEESSSDDWEWI